MYTLQFQQGFVGKQFKIHKTLSFRLIFRIALALLICFSVWSYLNFQFQNKKAIESTAKWADNLADTAKIAVGYAMMLNQMGDINKTLCDVSAQGGIDVIRIYSKKGEMVYSNRAGEVVEKMDINSDACAVCHMGAPPMERPDLMKRARIFESSTGDRSLGIISPFYNKAGCASAGCHKPADKKKILGLLYMTVPLKEVDKGLLFQKTGAVISGLVIILLTTSIIGFFIKSYIKRPVKGMISRMENIGKGEFGDRIEAEPYDVIGRLNLAINRMDIQISEKQEELNKHKKEYQTLFENSPCYITVQDRDFRLLRYNREFADTFDPKPGHYCYQAYKGRSERCEVCPVLGTFEDGEPRTSEETGINKDGTRSFWVVRTSPVKDGEGKVIAAMEMSLDVTHMKFLEDEARKSEQKYRTIFNTISDPIFVLDRTSLDILDCNNSVTAVYGYDKEEMLKMSFLDLYREDERIRRAGDLKKTMSLVQVKHGRKDGKSIYVNIYLSPSEYMGKGVLLAITRDITDRLMAEQQLIQASKMSTLGEMATGIAHELNQPLSVIKTACGFLLKKVRNKETVKESIMEELAVEMDSHVDRASKIINHMREFGRQSDVKKSPVHINEALIKALEIFSQQLKLREIEVEKDLERDLPTIFADSNRLEQVFINLLTNARDAIDERLQGTGPVEGIKKIFIKTELKDGNIIIEVRDTGVGVPDSIRDKIYDPFFTTKRVGMGTGLGLSISYGIVQDYGGTISLKSKEGDGAAFIIQFPVPDTQ